MDPSLIQEITWRKLKAARISVPLMAAACAGLLAFLLALSCARERRFLAADAAVGVNWGTLSSHRAPPSVVADLLLANRIGKVKLFDADPGVLRALARSGIQVMVGVTNDELAGIAGSTSVADAWVAQNVSRYVGRGGVDIRALVAAELAGSS